MLQEIIALSIVFGAVVYTSVNTYKFIFAAPKSGCASGCTGCDMKSEIKKHNRSMKVRDQKFTFKPEDLAFK